jgi:phenylalanyl-tRNA synthetase beta chain
MVRLRPSRVAQILGMEVAPERQVEILRALDFEVREAPRPAAGARDGGAVSRKRSERPPAGEGAFQVTVPPLRREDVTREADLIEEIARIDGLEKLPATLPARRGAYGVLSPEQRLRRRAVDALVGLGFYEVIGWTFGSREVLDQLRLAADDPRRRAAELEDPLSQEHSHLRTMLLGSLRSIAAYNAARDVADLSLFEVGTVFRLEDERIAERRALGILMSGTAIPASWRSNDPPRSDFFALKAVLDALAQALGVEVECTAGAPQQHPYLHPGRAAEVLAEGRLVGWLGELHPLVLVGELAGAAAMEIDLDAVIGAAASSSRPYRDLISYPPLRRDVAVSLPEQVPAAEVLAAVRGAGGEWLQEARIFDVYAGPQVGAGRRSLALSLAFRDPERTLTDEDVEPIRGRIEAAVNELGGELRG